MIFWSTPPPGGALYDATKVPCVRVVQAKVSRSLATIQHAILQSRRGDLSRVALAVTTGLLQSLVDAIPQRIRQTYLRELHNELHELDMWGKDMCCTDVVLSAKALADLEWWLAFLRINCGNLSRTATSGSLSVTFGNGSGPGTGGMLEALSHTGDSLPEIEPWMGVWAPHVPVYDSNWKKARTLLWTLVWLCNGSTRGRVRGATLFFYQQSCDLLRGAERRLFKCQTTPLGASSQTHGAAPGMPGRGYPGARDSHECPRHRWSEPRSGHDPDTGAFLDLWVEGTTVPSKTFLSFRA
jgi:hypothetical protein